MADSYGQISGQNTLKVDLEGHGRESGVIVDACPTMDELDLSQTVGWFTHVYPVLLTNAAGSDLAILIKGIKEQLRATPTKDLDLVLFVISRKMMILSKQIVHLK